MARRPTRDTSRDAPQEALPKLTVPREQLAQELGDRIGQGQELVAQPVRSEADLEDLRRRYYTWSEYNATLIKRSFTTSGPANEYSATPGAFAIGGFPSLVEQIREFHDDVQTKVRRLESLRDRLALYEEVTPSAPAARVRGGGGSKVFIVHGHSEATKLEVARTIAKITGNEPIILHEQPNSGRTIIEKFEDYAGEAGFAVILLTGDDEGRSKAGGDLQPRARQNVVFEMGFFIGAMGRGRVAVLYEDGVELPSDMSGVLYTSLASWQLDLAKEMRAAGLDVDLNLL